MFLNYRTFPRSAVRWAARLAALCLAAALPVAGARAENIIFPEDAGVIDVTKAPYNAKGDGAADDTEAIQKAFLDYAGKDAVIYLPNGTYRITDTISWAGKATRNILQGQSTDGTVLRLADRCGGFTDPTQPKPMVFTGKLPPQRFRNAIRNLTIDTGKGNPGAIGARFNASNQGQMANVTIRSGDGSGPIGLDMGYTSDVGPLFIKNLRVVGFDVGIYTAYGVAGQALEHISLQGQNVCGFINDGQAVSIRGFTSVNAVPAFFNKRVSGMAVILDASLTGEGAASRAAAIINDAALYARHVKTAGYRTAIDGSHGTGAGAPGPEVEEFVSHPVLSLFPSPMHSLNLPVTDTPEVPWDNLADWVSAAKFPPKEATIMKEHKEKDGTVKQVPTKVMDYTDSIQKAIDSGAKTVYFPTPKAGKPVYEVLGTVHVRGKVRRIIGMESAFGTQGTGVFQLDDGEAPVVVLERFDWIYSPIIVRTASKRTLVVSAIPGANYDVGPGGRVFLEDIVAMFRMAPGSHVWIRQFNTEYTQQWHANTLIDPRPLAEPPGSVNNGGTLWILGIKTEGDGTIITTTGGGQTEVLGGVIYANKDRDPKKKIFVNTESSLSVSLGEFVSRNQPFNPIVETRDGVTRTMPPGVTPGRAAGSLLALYTGYRAPAGQPTTVPIDLAAKHAAAPPPPAGSGNGLRGDYFAGAAFANLKATRTDPAIDFDWKDKPPAEGLAPDRYSVRWTGLIEPPVTGIYTFWIDPEGSRLMIDGEIVVNAWMKGARYRMGQIRLEAGRKVPIKVELRADGPAAKVLLQWYPPGQSRQAVPASQLYPPGDAAAPEVSLTATAATVTEGGTPVELKVERRGDTSRPLTVRLAPRAEIGTMLVLRLAERGDAVAGRDYAPVPDSITIPAGQAAASVPFVALDDKLPGQDRKAVFALDFNAGYNAAGGPVTIAIKNKHAPAPGGGTGLKGEYFAGKDFTNLKVTRVDATVDFGTDRWDQRPPAAGLDNKAMYAIRWTGEIEPLFSETYKIEAPASVYSTLRVWIDGKQVIDAQGKDALRIARVPLTAGRKVPIKIEYATTNFYGSNVHLLWSSASQFEQVVPKSQLYSAP